MWRKGNLIHCWWECKLVQSLWKTVWTFLKNLKLGLPSDPAIPLLRIYLKGMKILTQKDASIIMFITPLFKIPKTWKQSKCPSTDEWIKKLW